VHEDTRKYLLHADGFSVGATNISPTRISTGEPVQIYEPGEGDPIAPPDDLPPIGDDEDGPLPEKPSEDETNHRRRDAGHHHQRRRPKAKENLCRWRAERIIVAERIEYLDEDGKLITERSARLHQEGAEAPFRKPRRISLNAGRVRSGKQAILDELEAEGLPLEPIAEELGKDLDPFDLICHVAFDRKPLTRRERAGRNVKKTRYFFHAMANRRAPFSDALLAKYADEGVLNLDDANVLKITPFTALGTPMQLIKAFGGKDGFRAGRP